MTLRQKIERIIRDTYFDYEEDKEGTISTMMDNIMNEISKKVYGKPL